MARNIAPTLATRENEVQGLLAWSVLPVRVILFASLILGLKAIFFLLISPALWQPTLSTVISFAEGLAYVAIAVQLGRFLRFTEKYSQKDEDPFLSQAMTELTCFWIFLGVTVASSFLVTLLTLVGSKMFERSTFYWAIFPVLMGLIFFRVRQGRVLSVSKSFSQQINIFARINLARIRPVALFFIGTGVLYLGIYATNRLAFGVHFPFLQGVVAIAMGATLIFVWKSVREINRNSTLIYFERTLEKLNFFWLVMAAGFLTQLTTNIIILL